MMILGQTWSGLLAGFSMSAIRRRQSSLAVSSMRRGTGLRSSFSGNVVTVFGATGFVGRVVCSRLGEISVCDESGVWPLGDIPVCDESGVWPLGEIPVCDESGVWPLGEIPVCDESGVQSIG